MARKKTTFNPDDFRMSFGDHLEELRKRLIFGLIGIAIIAIGTFWKGMVIVDWLTAPVLRSLRDAGMPPTLNFTKVTDPFTGYIKVCLVSAAVIALPWVVYQLWKFISAGLYAHEQRIVHVLAPFSAVMTFLGVSFMYYILLPVCLTVLFLFAQTYPAPGGHDPGLLDWFTDIAKTQVAVPSKKPAANRADEKPDDNKPAGDALAKPAQLNIPLLKTDPPELHDGDIWFSTTENELHLVVNGEVLRVLPASQSSMRPIITFNEYISFVLFLGIGVIAAFQLPVLMTIVGWSGIIDPALVSRARKYCVFGCFVIGAVLTPQDPFSMFILAIPLWGLFEFGLILMRRTYPRKETG